MGWDGTGTNCYGMGWDRKICPMDKPANIASAKIRNVECSCDNAEKNCKSIEKKKRSVSVSQE